MDDGRSEFRDGKPVAVPPVGAGEAGPRHRIGVPWPGFGHVGAGATRAEAVKNLLASIPEGPEWNRARRLCEALMRFDLGAEQGERASAPGDL